MKILTSLLVLLLVLISLLANAQTLQTIRNLEDKHQIRLDTGEEYAWLFKEVLPSDG